MMSVNLTNIANFRVFINWNDYNYNDFKYKYSKIWDYDLLSSATIICRLSFFLGR